MPSSFKPLTKETRELLLDLAGRTHDEVDIGGPQELLNRVANDVEEHAGYARYLGMLMTAAAEVAWALSEVSRERVAVLNQATELLANEVPEHAENVRKGAQATEHLVRGSCVRRSRVAKQLAAVSRCLGLFVPVGYTQTDDDFEELLREDNRRFCEMIEGWTPRTIRRAHGKFED